ncbi:MAG TPA: bifunctional nicotinamidase/pyrazinamidase [Desulfobacteraceae bacterium]|nr:bifunctional nicotinamidase/pyrazinamidase [Desulfobacteraceae bacterium]
MVKALILVDLQNDFFEGGVLGVPESNSIIPVINGILNLFSIVVFTKDWHPEGHISFASSHKGKKEFDFIKIDGLVQILWPEHCIQNSFGSRIHDRVRIRKDAIFITKGSDKYVDSYSGFYDNYKKHSTGLGDLLKMKNVTDTYICGLATDYCVKYTAFDSVEYNFNTWLIIDASKAVNITSGDFDKAICEMKSKKIKIISSKELSRQPNI